MQYAVDLGFDDSGARHRGQQHAPQRVAERMAKATLERLDRDAGAIGTERLNLDGAGPQELRG
jgi:hypothetical protein